MSQDYTDDTGAGPGSLPVDVDAMYGCWLWTAAIDHDGYAVMLRKGQHPIRACRAVYEKRFGKIGKLLVLDHTCRRRA